MRYLLHPYMQTRPILQFFLTIVIFAHLQAAAANAKARYYGHDAVMDSYGVIAPWYQGLNGQCDFRVRIAAETLKRYPWTTTNNTIAAYPGPGAPRRGCAASS